MAIRAYMEGSNILLGCAINNHYFNQYFNISNNNHTTILANNISDIIDYHIVLDYNSSVQWNSIYSPRSNRFYINHDHDNI